jgi:hypothetical protein
MSVHPALARMASVSEEEAKQFPIPKRYQWAYARYQIEASDFQRGIRWKNTLKVSNAGARTVGYLAKMYEMLADEKDQKFALRAIDEVLALREVLSGGRWYRSGTEAAQALRRRIENRLAPSTVRLLESPPKPAPREAKPPPETKPTPPPQPGTDWIIESKRKVLEESEKGTQIRYLLVLKREGEAAVERKVSEKAYEKAKVGAVWSEPAPGEGDDR